MSQNDQPWAAPEGSPDRAAGADGPPPPEPVNPAAQPSGTAGPEAGPPLAPPPDPSPSLGAPPSAAENPSPPVAGASEGPSLANPPTAAPDSSSPAAPPPPPPPYGAPPGYPGAPAPGYPNPAGPGVPNPVPGYPNPTGPGYPAGPGVPNPVPGYPNSAGPGYPGAPGPTPPGQPPAGPPAGGPWQAVGAGPAGPGPLSTPYGQPPQAPAGPPKGKKASGPLLAAVIGGVVVIAVVVGLVVWRPWSGGGSSGAPTTATQAVQAYFDALNAGDAATALSLAKSQPVDSTFLTDAALKAALPQPISDLTLTEQSYGGSSANVHASYRIGGRMVNSDLLVEKFDKKWLVEKAAIDLPVSKISGYRDGMGLTFNGTAMPAGALQTSLFPGTYQVASDDPLFGFVDGDTFVVEDTTSVGQTFYELQIDISAAGQAAIGQAAKAKLDACVAMTTLEPEGCGFSLSPTTWSGQQISVATVSWSVDPTSDDVTKLTFRLTDPATTVAKAYGNIKLKAALTDTAGAPYTGTDYVSSVMADVKDPKNIVVTFK